MRRRLLDLRVLAAAALAIYAAVVLSTRVPTVLHDLRSQARAEAGRNDEGGALAAADEVELNNDFVRAAIHTVPHTAQFAVLYPDPATVQQTYGIDPVTLDALPPLMTEVLLPSRSVSVPVRGAYILCYVCNTSPWDTRTHWLWRNDKGMAIGQVYR